MDQFNIHEILKQVNQKIIDDPSNKEIFGIFTKIFNELPEVQLDAMNYFINNMPEDDITLVVIKGHLLLEQQVKNIFYSKFENPIILKNTKFDVNQIINLTEACFEQSTRNDYFWKCIKKLNNIRNDMAHNLENKGFEHKVNDLISIYNKVSYSSVTNDISTLEKLKSCIFGLAAELISLASKAMEERKSQEKYKHFQSMYQRNYVEFDNMMEEAMGVHDNLNEEHIKRREEFNFYKECANEAFFKLIDLVDITNTEYVHATYGALLAGRERAEKLKGKNLKNSLEELKEDHSNFTIKMNDHFKEKFDKLMGKTTDNLKLVLSEQLETELMK